MVASAPEDPEALKRCERGPEEEEASQQPGPPVTTAGEQQRGGTCTVPGEEDRPIDRHVSVPPIVVFPSQGSNSSCRVAWRTPGISLTADEKEPHPTPYVLPRIWRSRRHGPRGAEPPEAALVVGVLRGAPGDIAASIVRPNCYPLERQLPGGNSHPPRSGVFHGELDHCPYVRARVQPASCWCPRSCWPQTR